LCFQHLAVVLPGGLRWLSGRMIPQTPKGAYKKYILRKPKTLQIKNLFLSPL